MVSIWCSGDAITGVIWGQEKIGLVVEVASVEGKRSYYRSRFEGGTEPIHPDRHRGVQGQSHVGGWK